MPREIPKRFNTSQFAGMVNRSLRSGSMQSKGVKDVLKSSNTVRRAMAKSSMTEREAKTAFKVLHEKGMLKSQRQDHGDQFKKAVRVGQTKGDFEHIETLHEKAVREKRERRTQMRKDRQKREENLERYQQERAAEDGEVLQNKDGVVKMQAHGVAAKADQQKHSVSAGGSTSASASAQQKNKPDAKPTVLPDMFV